MNMSKRSKKHQCLKKCIGIVPIIHGFLIRLRVKRIFTGQMSSVSKNRRGRIPVIFIRDLKILMLMMRKAKEVHHIEILSSNS